MSVSDRIPTPKSERHQSDARRFEMVEYVEADDRTRSSKRNDECGKRRRENGLGMNLRGF